MFSSTNACVIDCATLPHFAELHAHWLHSTNSSGLFLHTKGQGMQDAFSKLAWINHLSFSTKVKMTFSSTEWWVVHKPRYFPLMSPVHCLSCIWLFCMVVFLYKPSSQRRGIPLHVAGPTERCDIMLQTPMFLLCGVIHICVIEPKTSFM